MATPEGLLWQRLRGGIAMVGRPHICRIESHATSVGFPDVEMCWDGVMIWVELKSWDPKKGWHIRPSQLTWMRDRLMAGGKNIFVIADRKTALGPMETYAVRVTPSFLRDYERHSSKDAIIANASLMWVGTVNFTELKEFLCQV